MSAMTVLFDLHAPREELFVEALTHSSYANEHRLPNNERLEFLGDSVLSMIVCQYLYLEFPRHSEGQLAKLKSILVSAAVLARFSTVLELDEHLLLGSGESRSNGKQKVNILADLFEAFLGAFYLNFGLEKTTDLVLPLIQAELPEIITKYEEIDAKTTLQEIAQARGLKPVYHLIGNEGPPHNRLFTVSVQFGDEFFGRGTGRSIKEAENKAALAVIQALNVN